MGYLGTLFVGKCAVDNLLNYLNKVLEKFSYL